MAILASVLARQTAIGPAREEQRDAILAFQRSAIASITDRFYNQQAKEAWWRTPAIGLEALIADGRYFVVTLGGRLVAGAGWEPYRDERTAMLRGVFVDPSVSGLGLGVRAVRQIEAEVRADGRTTLIVPAALNAISFYEKLGYVAQGRERTEYEAGLQLEYQVMSKTLIGN